MKSREKGKTQRTREGHEIPVPKKGEFFDNLKKASKPSPPEKDDESSGSDGGEEE